jgi:hypothetical protein
VLGLASVIAATVLATGGLLHDWQGPGSGDVGLATGRIGGPVTAAPEPEPARLASHPDLASELAVDVIGEAAAGGLVLATGDGRTLDLGPISKVVSAHRVGDGWAVVSGHPGTTRLWWVSAGERPVSLLAGMDSIAIDGERVGWRRGSLLFAATLSGQGELAERVTTTAPDGDGHPVGFVGQAVLLARSEPAGWDIWQPAAGDYQPAWTGRVIRVYGELAGGQAALGLVPPEPGASGPCLAELDPGRGLAPARAGCLPGGLSAAGPAALSPRGRWLITTQEGAGTVLVDVTAALAEQPSAVTEVPDLPAPAGPPVWVDPEQALVPTADSLVRVVPEQLFAGVTELVALPATGMVVVEPV